MVESNPTINITVHTITKGRAKKCSESFRHRGVVVTTKHSYAIDYKYVWECIECGIEYKRHSKSIDPLRHTCGACRSKLVQTRPAPRKAGPSDYQRYIKENYARMRDANPQGSQKELMGMLAKAYKNEKKDQCRRPGPVSDAIGALGHQEDALHEKDEPTGKPDVDLVARTLHFLSLES